jgi:hypothetical protein
MRFDRPQSSILTATCIGIHGPLCRFQRPSSAFTLHFSIFPLSFSFFSLCFCSIQYSHCGAQDWSGQQQPTMAYHGGFSPLSMRKTPNATHDMTTKQQRRHCRARAHAASNQHQRSPCRGKHDAAGATSTL